MSVYEDIKNGLLEAIEYQKGNLPEAKVTIIEIAPVEKFSPMEIKEIRTNTGLTQTMFAYFMGVSKKTVAAWESGKKRPKGPACRLLALAKKDPSFPKTSGIVSL